MSRHWWKKIDLREDIEWTRVGEGGSGGCQWIGRTWIALKLIINNSENIIKEYDHLY